MSNTLVLQEMEVNNNNEINKEIELTFCYNDSKCLIN